MEHRWIRWAAVVAAAVIATAATTARAETFSLQLKRLEGVADRTTGPPTDYMFRGMNAQRFFRQTGLDEPGMRPGQADEPDFDQVITKEPDRYYSKSPFRGVATLGSRQFGFVLDADKPPADEQDSEGESQEPAPPAAAQPQPGASPRFTRLLFDLNGNGDLTDDPVIQVEPAGAGRYPVAYSAFSFPRVDLTVDVDGTPIEYGFFLSGYSHSQSINEKTQFHFTSVTLQAAVYREAEITLDGRNVRIVVTDFNSNGRFDDVSMIDPNIRGSGDTLYPRFGDMVFVDPGQQTQPYVSPYDPTSSDAQHPLANVIAIAGRYYDIRITPAGDTLTLTPTSAAIGHVSNSNRGYRALVHSDDGILKIQGDESGRAPLPPGSWKLLSYTLVRSDEEVAAESAAEPSMLQSLANTLLGRGQMAGPQITMVSARATRDYPAIEVREGETAEMAFGAPFSPRVSGNVLQNGSLSLGMELVGAGGEVCSNLIVNSSRPAKPTFTITDPEGEVVQRGSFEYG